MADVTVKITDIAIIRAVGTPGGPVYEWRDQVTEEITNLARTTSPVNDPLNALHRGGEVGTYKASWSWDRRGSQGHNNIGRVQNSAGHAQVVEYGRSSSHKLQVFSWTEWGGMIGRVGGPVARKLKTGAVLTKRAQAFNERAMAFNRSLESLPERHGNKTAAREGDHILALAAEAVLGGQGIAVSVH